MKPIYKSVALLFGALASMSSCDDFLTRDSEDQYVLSEYLTSENALLNYTFQLYGSKTWNGFDDKFAWCVGEIYSGNVYHNYGDEGQFHFMTFSNENTNIADGYTSLYAVIGRCNQIINDATKVCRENGISEAAINRAIGEAKMYRGMAYFMLAEYFGASPILLNNTQIISGGSALNITRADRESLYALIEKDWKEAYDLLPADKWGNKYERVTKYAAAGMLAKLYVTMASCQTEIADANQKYICPDPDTYYNQAITYATEVINARGSDLVQGYEAYDKMFQPGEISSEYLFGLLFETGEYGVGSSRQQQFARSAKLNNKIQSYGGEKGLTTNLFNSYEAGDIRKKATSYFNAKDEFGAPYTDQQVYNDWKNGTGDYYTLADGSKYYYFLNPNKTLSDEQKDALGYGAEPNSAIFNHIRKFVYSAPTTADKFSLNLTIPFLRVADVYLLRAEAKMGLANKGVTEESAAGVADINVIRKRAGISDISTCAFYAKDDYAKGGNAEIANITDDEGGEYKISAKSDVYTFKYDLMSERRWEFAMENQCWLDIKRLYYRDAEAALSYIKEQDRGFIYGEKFNDDVEKKDCKDHFQRQSIIFDLSNQAHEFSSAYTVQAEEKKISYDNITWFLPVPNKVDQSGNFAIVGHYVEEIKNGTYRY